MKKNEMNMPRINFNMRLNELQLQFNGWFLKATQATLMQGLLLVAPAMRYNVRAFNAGFGRHG